MHRLVVFHVRLWLALAAGIMSFFAMPAGWSTLSRLLVAWDTGALLFLVLVFVWMGRCNAAQMRVRYQDEDPSAPVILLVVTLAALLSLAAIVALLSTLSQVERSARAPHFWLATLTVTESWLLVATMFTLHYADMFYSAKPDEPPLLFPRTAEPLFWDFVYFSFTIAAACQTADVSTTQAPIRRAVLAQSLVSFVFNLSIIGFAVNVSAGLLGH
jgi:uncharacterized membrane protein